MYHQCCHKFRQASKPLVISDYFFLFVFFKEMYSSIVFKRVQAVEGALSFILNTAFLLVLSRNRDLVKQKRITYHIANLAVADTFVGASLVCRQFLGGSFWYKLLYVVNSNAITMSCLAIVLMSIERAVVIIKPFTWIDILPLKRTVLAISSTWISVFILSVIEYFFISLRDGNTMRLFLISFLGLSTVVINGYVVWTLRREQRRSAAMSNNQDAAQRLKKKAVTLLVKLTTIMLLTGSPYALFHFFCFILNLKNNVVPHLIYTERSLFTFALTNFVVNPIIYIWSVSMYRKALRRMFESNANAM